AVGVPVQAGLADQDLERAPERLGHALDLVAQRVDLHAAGRGRRLADARRRAVGAEHVAQRLRPLAGRDAGAGGLDRRGHDVLALFSADARQLGQRRVDRRLVAVRAPALQRLLLLGLDAGV